MTDGSEPADEPGGGGPGEADGSDTREGTEAALDAVGNPTRRALLRLLSDGERTVREMTDALPVTQSAVSQHLRVLRDAGLVTVRPDGTRRLYAIDLGGLVGVRAWVESFWDDILTAFVDHAEANSPSTQPPSTRPRPATDPSPSSQTEQSENQERP